MKRMLMLASVASMIDQFNMPNIRLLQEMGYEVHVACNFKKGSTCTEEKIIKLKNTLKDMGVPYYQIDFDRNVLNIANDFKAYRQVVKLAEKYKYNFIHCHSPIGGVVGRCAAHKTHTKVVYTAHGFHFYKGAPLINWMVYYPIEKICSYMTDVLICINKEDYALAKRKMKAKKVEYIPGVGIDLTKYGPMSPEVKQLEKNRLCNEIGIDNDSKILLSVGELNENKNHEVVIRAVAKMEDKSIAYLIAGKGALRPKLERISDNLGIRNQVRFLGFRSDVDKIYKISDIFLFPSKREGLPVALMEACASSVPSIVSNIRGNIDIIENGETGIVVNENKPEEYARNIEVLLHNKKIYEKYILKMKNKMAIYSQENVSKKIFNIYSCL